MEVRPVGDVRHLYLPARRLFGWLELAELELRIPAAVSAPPSLGDVPAISFQRVRSEVVSARLSMLQSDLDGYVSGCGAALAALGVDELMLRCSDSYIGLSARVRESALVADLSARIYLSSKDNQLRITCGHPRVYGHLDTPAPILIHKLVSAILNVGESSNATAFGPCDFRMDPLRSALFHSLPAAGWRLPTLSTAPLVSAEVTSAGLVLHFSETPKTVATSSQAAAALADSLHRFRAPDALLLAEDLEGAMRGYRGELAARGPEQPFLVERILSIASARREYFMDGMELARQVLGRWPDFAPAHAAVASIAVAKGDVESGAARYRELSQASGAVGDEEGKVRAALAGARLLRQFAPDDSTRLYEVVLEHRPGHAEAAEALADRYRDEERWSDLLRLIRMRLAATSDPRRQARDHARLAEVLLAEQNDPDAALAELAAACRLDETITQVHEQRADIEFLLGKDEDALSSLEWACSLHRMRKDERGHLRCLIRGGHGCLLTNRHETAEAWFLAALDIEPSHGPAMRGAARAAAGLGHHDDASRLWRELFDAGIEAPAIQAYFACELGRSLLEAGTSTEALPPLLRASETGGARTRAEALALLARIHLKSGAHAEALAAWKLAIERFSSLQPDEAYEDEDMAVERRQQAAELSLQRGEVGMKLGREAESMQDLRRAFDLSFAGEHARRESARLLLKRTPTTEGELLWIQELRLDNTDPDECAYLDIRRASVLTAEGDPQAGLAALVGSLANAEVSDAPKRAALELKAEILETLGDVAARADVLEERANLSGPTADRARAFVESAEGWLSADDPQRCRSALRLALQVLEDAGPQPELRERALLCLGDCAWRCRNWAEVDEACEELYADATASAPPQRLLRWGVSLETLGKSAEAIEVLERVTSDASCPKPLQTQAFRHLANLYERGGELHKAGIAQERYAASEANELSSAAQADAWYQAGAIHRRNADATADAKRCLDNALRIASDHLPALDALEQIARDEGSLERLAVILGRKVAVMSAHPTRQRGLLVRLAKLQEDLGRTDVARETYRRVLTIAPSYRPALLFAARDAQASSNHPFASEALELLSGPLENDGELPLDAEEILAQREEALFDLAAQVIGTAGQVASASVTALLLREARERDDFRLWAALAAAYRRQANLAALADTLGRLTKHAEPAQALELSLERIELLVNEIGDHGGALIALRIAQELAPDNRDLQRWHDVLCGDATSDNRATQDGVQAQDSNFDARDSADLFADDPLADDEFADDELADVADQARALISEGEWSSALALLEPYDDIACGEEVLWLHVEAALGAGQSRKAIVLLPSIARLAHLEEDLIGEHRATRRLADLVLETEGAEDVALRLYQRALALDPSDLIAAELCEELQSASNAVRVDETLVAPTEPQSPSPGPTNEALSLRAKARQALGTGNIAGAINMLEEALFLAPHIPSLHHECADMALAANDPAKAVHWLETLAAQVVTGEAGHSQYGESLSDLHLQIADLYYDKLSSPSKARHHMRCAANACTSELRRAATLRQLASEAASAGCLDEAIEAYESIGLAHLSSHERLAVAKLYQQVARDHASIEILESARLAGILTNEGRSLLFALHRNRARNQELAESLERGARSAPNPIAVTRLREALRIYEDVLADAAGAFRMREALSDLTAEDGSENSQLAPTAELEQAAEDAAANGDDEVAASLLCRAIQTHCQRLGASGAPVDGATRGLVQKLREQVLSCREEIPLGQFSQRSGPTTREVHALVRALSAVAAIEENRDAAATLLREIALLRRNELHDIRGAADAMAQALSLRADDPDILVELADMLTEAGDHTQLASAYELHLSTIEGPGRALPLIELGKLCQHIFNEHERARRCYDEAYELDESVGEQIRALRQTLDANAGRGNIADQELSAELDRALAMESQGRLPEALDLYEAAATTAPGDPRPFIALRRIYEDRGETERLARVLEQLTTLSSSRHERAGLFYDRAILARDEYHDDMLVYEYLKEAAANAPDDPRYSHALRTIAMARGEWALAAELTYREISASSDAEELGALYLELALIFDEKLLDAPQALANYEQALTLDPSIPAAPRPLARLYELATRYEDAAEMYQKAAELTPDPTERGRLYRHAAMNAEQADLGELARSLYARIEEEADRSDREAAIAATTRIQVDDDSRSSGLLSVDEMRARLVDAEADPSERAKLLFQLGQAYQHELQDPNAALRAYEESLRLDPGLMVSIDALADLCYQQRDWARAHHFYQGIQPELSALPPAQVALRQAEIAEALGNEVDAFEAFQWALEFAPNDTQVLAGLCRTASRVGEHAEALLAQQTLVRLIPVEEVDQLQAARVYLAELYLSLGDVTGAVRSYEELLGDMPDSIVAKRALPELYQSARQPEQAIAALKALIQVTPGHSERAQLLFELGEAQGDSADNPRVAAEAYFRAIDLAPDHVPTLRRLLAYYSDEGDFQATSEMAADLLRQSALLGAQTSIAVLYRAGLAAALSGDLRLARSIGTSLGHGAPEEVARAVRKVFELANCPPVKDLAEATRTLCDAAGEDLTAVSEALSTHESAKNLLHLIKALGQLAV
tara:strand:+ start:78844 stop:86601 length:7758 start_codon:yes stop_codon:yes gene_type:complete